MGQNKKGEEGLGCKEIEENNGMGKTRDLFKKIRDTKGTFHSKMGTIKDGNSRDLTETEVFFVLFCFFFFIYFFFIFFKFYFIFKLVARIHRRTAQKRSSRPR